MRKVFLEDLPHKKNNVDWKASVGYEIRFIYDNTIGLIKIIAYNKIGNRYKVTLQYKNKVISINNDAFCKCQIEYLLGTRTKQYKYKIKELVNTNSGYIQIIDQTKIPNVDKIQKGYKYKCLKCGYIGICSETNLVKKFGCPVCDNKIIIKGINDMWTTAPDIAKLLANPEDGYKYTQCSHQKVDWKCPDCGNIIKNKKISEIYVQGLSCHTCGSGISYSERLIYNILKQLKIKVKTQLTRTTFDWCNNYRYDFYLRDFKIIIETDGGFHFIDNNMTGQTKEESKAIDEYKDKLAKEHGIEVIRIDCQKSDLEYIKNNILKSKLSELFDLSKIDWKLADKESQKSLVKQACDLWNIGAHSTIEIGIKLNLSDSTIRNYLKKGTIHNLCDYNAKESQIRNGYYRSNHNRIKIICTNTKEIFPSMHYIEKETKINIGSICSCCKNKQKSAGKLSDGTPLKWMYLTEFMQQNGYTDILQIPNVIIHNESQENQLAS